MLKKEKLDEIVLRELNLEAAASDLSDWNKMLENIKASKGTVRIAMVGKYIQLHDAYLSVIEALKSAAWNEKTDVDIKWVDAEDLEKCPASDLLNDVDGILVPGGFGKRGINGKIEAARYARENNIPYLGICLGMQTAVIEFARNVLGYKDASSSEFDPESEHNVIDLMEDQKGKKKGGTMRLGSYPCSVKEGTVLEAAYKSPLVAERHRHRYEFNNEYRTQFEKNGMTLSGLSPDGSLVEAVEIKDNPFYLGVQFHPEFKSRPNRPHPVFLSFVKASIKKAK